MQSSRCLAHGKINAARFEHKVIWWTPSGNSASLKNSRERERWMDGWMKGGREWVTRDTESRSFFLICYFEWYAAFSFAINILWCQVVRDLSPFYLLLPTTAMASFIITTMLHILTMKNTTKLLSNSRPWYLLEQMEKQSITESNIRWFVNSRQSRGPFGDEIYTSGIFICVILTITSYITS